MEKNKLLDQQENIKTIHTYSSDMADAVRTNETSVIKIALAEQKKHEQESLYKEANGTKTSKAFLFLGGLIIIILSIGGVYYVMQKKKIDNNPPKQETTINKEALISYEDQSSIDMTNVTNQNDALDIINTESKKSEKDGIKILFLTHIINGKTELLPLEDFLSLIKTTAPSSLIRSFDTSYMIGTYKTTDTQSIPHLFLLFQTKNYNQSYAGMLIWEKTLLYDLSGLFKIDISGDNNTLIEKPWSDVILDNKNARILYDLQKNSVLYYIFINKDYFMITDNQDSIKEVTKRLLTKNIKPL